MELQHLEVKLPLAPAGTVDPEAFIPIFHEWIREKRCEEMLVDVADYRHLPGGPGVILVGHEADYALDDGDGRPGLRYRRKAPVEGGNEEALRQALRALLDAARRLEAEPALEGRLRFSRSEVEVVVNDRLAAPNTPATLATLLPEIEGFFRHALDGERFSLVPQVDPRRCFGVTLAAARPFDLEALRGRLET